MVLRLGTVFIILMSARSSAFTLWVCMVYPQLSVGANTFQSATLSSMGNHITIHAVHSPLVAKQYAHLFDILCAHSQGRTILLQ